MSRLTTWPEIFCFSTSSVIAYYFTSPIPPSTVPVLKQPTVLTLPKPIIRISTPAAKASSSNHPLAGQVDNTRCVLYDEKKDGTQCSGEVTISLDVSQSVSRLTKWVVCDARSPCRVGHRMRCKMKDCTHMLSSFSTKSTHCRLALLQEKRYSESPFYSIPSAWRPWAWFRTYGDFNASSGLGGNGRLIYHGTVMTMNSNRWCSLILHEERPHSPRTPHIHECVNPH